MEGWLQIAWTVLMSAAVVVHVGGTISRVMAETRARGIVAKAQRRSAELQQEQYELTRQLFDNQGTTHE